jgi:hypothetical protein
VIGRRSPLLREGEGYLHEKGISPLLPIGAITCAWNSPWKPFFRCDTGQPGSWKDDGVRNGLNGEDHPSHPCTSEMRDLCEEFKTYRKRRNSFNN